MKSINCEDNASKANLSSSRISELTEIAREASDIGGKILMSFYGNLNNIRNKGRDGDLVTEADLKAEMEIIGYLKKYTPEINIYAEESGIIGHNEGLCWCIDPLDGTTNFTHGYPFFASSIGLSWNEKPLLGSISVPFLKETYWAAPGIGSYCNNDKNKMSVTKSLKDSLLVTGFAYDRKETIDNNYSEFCSLTHKTRGVRRGGAAAVDLAFVAAGRLDGYWERGLSKWDLAAGVSIVEIAGGIVTDYKTEEFILGSGRVLASTPGIAIELKNELKRIKPFEEYLYASE